ncbi:hypothetical protein MD484_g6858, partial [Candolleomyces efflorescens]
MSQPKREIFHVQLSQPGRGFMSIPNPLEVLKCTYDILELQRFLWKRFDYLHRDINPYSIEYTPIEHRSEPAPDLTKESADNPTASDNSKDPELYFVDAFLNEGSDPLKATARLIDFDTCERKHTEIDVLKELVKDRAQQLGIETGGGFMDHLAQGLASLLSRDPTESLADSVIQAEKASQAREAELKSKEQAKARE